MHGHPIKSEHFPTSVTLLTEGLVCLSLVALASRWGLWGGMNSVHVKFVLVWYCQAESERRIHNIIHSMITVQCVKDVIICKTPKKKKKKSFSQLCNKPTLYLIFSVLFCTVIHKLVN